MDGFEKSKRMDKKVDHTMLGKKTGGKSTNLPLPGDPSSSSTGIIENFVPFGAQITGPGSLHNRRFAAKHAANLNGGTDINNNTIGSTSTNPMNFVNNQKRRAGETLMNELDQFINQQNLNFENFIPGTQNNNNNSLTNNPMFNVGLGPGGKKSNILLTGSAGKKQGVQQLGIAGGKTQGKSTIVTGGGGPGGGGGGPNNTRAYEFQVASDKIDREQVMKNLSRMAIRRMARRGGVKRISAKIYPECREVMALFLEKVLRDAVTYLIHSRRSTVRPVDIVNALKRQGKSIYGYGS